MGVFNGITRAVHNLTSHVGTPGVPDPADLLVEHTPGDLAGTGIGLQVGDDHVGFYLSEKSATAAQVYDNAGGAYDLEFVEQDADFHFKFVHPDGGIAIPALGMLPQYSAAPHSGVEQEGESYYDTTTHKAYTWDDTTWQAWW